MVNMLDPFSGAPGSSPGPATTRYPEGVKIPMLSWNVYIGDFNTGEIMVFNIFNYRSFYNACLKAKKKFKGDKEGFAEEVKSWLRYFFWSKCEWEVVLQHWPSGEQYGLRKVFTLEEMYHDMKYPEDKLLGSPDRRFQVRVFPEHNRFREKKIDVFEQVNNNWGQFIDYLWNNRKELKEVKKDGTEATA